MWAVAFFSCPPEALRPSTWTGLGWLSENYGRCDRLLARAENGQYLVWLNMTERY